MTLGSVDDLGSIYRQPRRGPVDKVIDRLDEHCADFLAKSPFFVLSSANADGVCDGSPKGGPPGFVEMLDNHRVAWADYSGNNRLDSFQNIVSNPGVALLLGCDEDRFRILNGRTQSLGCSWRIDRCLAVEAWPESPDLELWDVLSISRLFLLISGG